jgi:ATP-binding cassette, subfamily B, bacterial PglK
MKFNYYQNIRQNLSEICFFLPYALRFQVLLWSITNFILTILNLFSYLLLVPFFSGLISINSINKIEFISIFKEYFDLSNLNLLNTIGISAIIFIFFTNFLLLYNEKIKFNIIRKIAVNVSDIYLSNFLNTDYAYLQTKQKANVLTRLLIELEGLITNIFYNLFDISSRLLLIILIVFGLSWVNFNITFFATIVFLLVIGLGYFLLKNNLDKFGSNIVLFSQKRTESLSVIADNFVLFKIFNISKEYIYEYLELCNKYFIIITKSEVLKKVPRVMLEFIFFIVLILVTLIYINYYLKLENLERIDDEVLIFVGVYAIAAYRLMPSVQQIFYLMTEIKNNYPKLETIYKDIKNLQKNRKQRINKKISITNNSDENKIIIKNLTYKRNNKFLFNKFNLIIDLKKTYCLWGESGSGKTTLLFLIMGILKPDSGEVIYNNNHMYNIEETSKIFSFAQDPAKLIEGKTIIQNLHPSKNINRKKTINLFKKSFFINKKILNSNLSSGEIKRITVSRALNSKSKLIILDEPTSNLDQINKKNLIKILKREFKNKKAGLIYATHDRKLKLLADKIINL